MMLRSVYAAFAGVLFSGTAFGADRIPYTAPPIPALSPIAYDWNGVYAGFQAGSAWGDEYFVDLDDDDPYPYEIDGWKLGGHVGYQAQRAWLVAGVEADFEWADLKSGRPVLDDGVSTQINFQTSFRGRLGVALNHVLIYATGGVAYADIDGELFDGGPDVTEAFDLSRWGVTGGAGAEVGITPNVRAGVEYRYTDFDFERQTSSTAFPGLPFEWDTDEHVVRGRLSFGLGGAHHQ